MNEGGQRGEDLACRHLRRRGLEILERNYLCRAGEIDVVARDGDTVVFVEVKERGGDSHGGAVEAVTPHKRRRVIKAAQRWASAHGATESLIRFDVVAIDWTDGEPHGGAFDADERGAFERPTGAQGHRETRGGVGAGNGIRTRDFDLGKVALYH